MSVQLPPPFQNTSDGSPSLPPASFLTSNQKTETSDFSNTSQFPPWYSGSETNSTVQQHLSQNRAIQVGVPPTWKCAEGGNTDAFSQWPKPEFPKAEWNPGCSSNYRKFGSFSSGAHKSFFCDSCNRGFGNQEELDEHRASHVKCPFEKCNFKAHPKIVLLHQKLQHSTGLAEKMVCLDTPEGIRKWREERKRKPDNNLSAEPKDEKQAEDRDVGMVSQERSSFLVESWKEMMASISYSPSTSVPDDSDRMVFSLESFLDKWKDHKWVAPHKSKQKLNSSAKIWIERRKKFPAFNESYDQKNRATPTEVKHSARYKSEPFQRSRLKSERKGSKRTDSCSEKSERKNISRTVSRERSTSDKKKVHSSQVRRLSTSHRGNDRTSSSSKKLNENKKKTLDRKLSNMRAKQTLKKAREHLRSAGHAKNTSENKTSSKSRSSDKNDRERRSKERTGSESKRYSHRTSPNRSKKVSHHVSSSRKSEKKPESSSSDNRKRKNDERSDKLQKFKYVKKVKAEAKTPKPKQEDKDSVEALERHLHFLLQSRQENMEHGQSLFSKAMKSILDARLAPDQNTRSKRKKKNLRGERESYSSKF